MTRWKSYSVCIVALVLSACHTQQFIDNTDKQIKHTYQEGIDKDVALGEPQSALPPDINAVLLPNIKVDAPENTTQAEETFNIAVKDVPAQSFFMGLVKGTELSMIVSPKITGTITLNLKNVTLEQALSAVEAMYGYEYIKTSYGYQIQPGQLQTRIFTVDYLDVGRKGESETDVNSTQLASTNNNNNNNASNGIVTNNNNNNTNNNGSNNGATSLASKVATTSSTDFWKTLQATLTTIIGGGGGRSVITDPQTGIVVVRAFPKELDRVADFLDTAQHALTRQVVIEAKIIEVELNDTTQMGINWNLLGAQLNSNNVAADALPNFTEIFSLKVSSASEGFNGILRLLETQGTIHVLSNPRIATLNNQKAIIKIGNDKFFVTSVSNNVASTTVGNNTTSGVDLTPFFSGIALDVTPQIAKDGTITLYIHPLVSEVTQNDITVSTGGTTPLSLPSAASKVRETDSIVSAENGQIIILGGLMQSDVRKTTARTPILSNLPGIGRLFTQENSTLIKSELVILLRPTVIESKTWAKKLQNSQANVEHVLKSIALINEPPTKDNKPRTNIE